MPTDDQKKNIAGAIDAIRSAEELLRQEINKTGDVLEAIKLTNEFNNLDSFLSQTLHAQNSADDESFASAAAALQSQSSALKADEATIQQIVKDVKIAADVVGYVIQAIEFIAKI